MTPPRPSLLAAPGHHGGATTSSREGHAAAAATSTPTDANATGLLGNAGANALEHLRHPRRGHPLRRDPHAGPHPRLVRRRARFHVRLREDSSFVVLLWVTVTEGYHCIKNSHRPRCRVFVRAKSNQMDCEAAPISSVWLHCANNFCWHYGPRGGP